MVSTNAFHSPNLFYCFSRCQAPTNKIAPLSSIRSDEGLALEKSAFESLYGGQFTLSTQLIKPNYFVILPPTQLHSLYRNVPPLLVCERWPSFSCKHCKFLTGRIENWGNLTPWGGGALLARENGNESRFPGTRRSLSILFTTDVKEEI